MKKKGNKNLVVFFFVFFSFSSGLFLCYLLLVPLNRLVFVELNRK